MIKKRDTLIQPRISVSFFEINILSYRSRESILLRTEGAISEIVLEMLVQFLHSFDDSRMHLTDATLAQIQSRTDFFHRHFFTHYNTIKVQVAGASSGFPAALFIDSI